jgi:hypothetical protein
MRRATTLGQTLVRLTGLIQIVLGLLFWSAHALTLVPVHMLVGGVLALSLWELAILAAVARAATGLAALAGLWGLLVPALGLFQARILPGDAHWAVQVAHLMVGLAAIGLAEALAARVKGTASPWASWSGRAA